MGLIYFFAAVLGLCIGSFLNVLVYRLPRNMNIATPGSHCPECGYQLKWYDNIPVLSYIILGGRCRKCKTHISFRYTAVEIVNTLLWVGCVYVFWEKSIPMACVYAATLSVFLTMFFTDLETYTVPDSIQIALLLFGVCATVFDKNYPWYSHLIGAFAFSLVFWLVAFIITKKRGVEALGGGDIKLAFVSGLILGWEKMLGAMLIASVFGSLIIVILQRVKKNGRDTEYPFVPFIVSGASVMIFFGDYLIEQYKSLLTLFMP